jgi:hypothetical protein
MSAVAIPMPLSVMTKVYLRPTRSPIRPNTAAPNGRIKNPAVKVPTYLIRSDPDWLWAKNREARRLARLPKM